MGVADELERELPYLRRYARAVTGRSERGDELIERVVEHLVQTDTPNADRLALFTLLDKVIADYAADEPSTEIAALSAGPRRALLLTSMESFSKEQAALIMDVPSETITAFLEQAERELQASLATDVFVIEDEPLVAAHIAQIASQMGHTVIGQAVTHESAVAACLNNPPRLLLADVQLADGSSGAEAAYEIRQTHDIPVIFITAYPQTMLLGSEGEPAYLIPKPFRPDMVKAVISQALIQQAARSEAKK